MRATLLGGRMMPKMKTHKGIKKRFKVSAKGKVRHKRAGSSHLMSGKGGGRCRKLRRPRLLEGAVQKRVRRALAAG